MESMRTENEKTLTNLEEAKAILEEQIFVARKNMEKQQRRDEGTKLTRLNFIFHHDQDQLDATKAKEKDL